MRQKTPKFWPYLMRDNLQPKSDIRIVIRGLENPQNKPQIVGFGSKLKLWTLCHQNRDLRPLGPARPPFPPMWGEQEWKVNRVYIDQNSSFHWIYQWLVLNDCTCQDLTLQLGIRGLQLEIRGLHLRLRDYNLRLGDYKSELGDSSWSRQP